MARQGTDPFATAAAEVVVAMAKAASPVAGIAGRLLVDSARAAADPSGAIRELYEDWVRELDAKVAELEQKLADQGKRIDRLDNIAELKLVLERYVLAMAARENERARAAVANAACNQVNPLCGDRSARRFWWSVLEGLTDIEIDVLLVFGTGLIVLHQGALFQNDGPREASFAHLRPMEQWNDGASRFAAVATLDRLENSEPVRLVVSERTLLQVDSSSATNVKTYSLSPGGKILVGICS